MARREAQAAFEDDRHAGIARDALGEADERGLGGGRAEGAAGREAREDVALVEVLRDGDEEAVEADGRAVERAQRVGEGRAAAGRAGS